MSRSTWEYKVVDLPFYNTEIVALLNNLGRQGWEAVAELHGHFKSHTVLLKRKKQRTK